MICRAAITPCPVPTSLDQLFSTNTDETTTILDFTTEFDASLRRVKAKRPGKYSVQFTIHEDAGAEKVYPDVTRTQLSQPPRRVPKAQDGQAIVEDRKPQFPTPRDQPVLRKSSSSSTTHLGQAPKRLKSRISTIPENNEDSMNKMRSPATEIFRPARRGTLYIPNEDTTMPSMYMGVFSPIKDFNPEVCGVDSSELQVEMTGIAAQMAMKRAGQKSLAQSAPQRSVLRTSSRKLQQTTFTEDKFGSGGGKENIPPFAQSEDKGLLTTNATRYCGARSSPPKISGIVAHVVTDICSSTVSAPRKRELTGTSHARQSITRPAWNAGPRQTSSSLLATSQAIPKLPPPSLASLKPLEPKIPTRFVLPTIAADSADSVTQQYPLLKDDGANSAMYEDRWLCHQEIVVTQLVNKLFSASKRNEAFDTETQRTRLLQAYCSAPMVLLHKRLRAALLYGALSIPQETLETGLRLQTDVGLRKRFIDIWLHTYSSKALKAALEVVVGREFKSDRLSASTSTISKAAIRKFIELFLIRNEDGNSDMRSTSRISWSYQRTVLRSLLLVKVLDLSKTDPRISDSECLFQATSSFKSSNEVVKALIQILNPAAGDPIRALSHVSYTVTHAQCSLDEYDYHIENLAVDLRDGIRLTRLVELLLYPSTSQDLERSFDGGTTTLLLPEGEMLDFEDGQEWPLSQHLKTTNQSRAVRLWNVQLALAALNNVKGVSAMVAGITADDVVDGFREKTIQLLWTLVSKWGLVGLVNWQDLRWEIRRLEKAASVCTAGLFTDDDLDEEDLSLQGCRRLLQRWSRAVAESRGLTIQNLTTSFANGAVFGAIVDEYEQHIDSPTHLPQALPRLEDRLTRLGCSSQFSGLFTKQKQTHIYDRDFVLAALAFLCSRLLASSQRSRAATAIQKAWRQHRYKVEISRKREKKRIASACAELVQTKQTTISTRPETQPDSIMLQQSSQSTTLHGKLNNVCYHPTPSPAGSSDIWLNLTLS